MLKLLVGDMLENLSKYNVVLASNSPRRKELLSGLGIPYEVKTLPDIDESFPEGLDAVDTLPGDQQQEGDQDEEDITHRCLQEIEEGADTVQMADILTQNVRIGNDGGIIGVGGGTIGDEAGIALGIGGHRADLMGDGLTVAFRVLGHVGDDVTLLQGGGIHLLHKDQVTCSKIRCRHGVRIHDVGLVAEQVTIIAVKGGDRNNRKDHHEYCQHNHHPNQDCFDCFEYTFRLHAVKPLFGSCRLGGATVSE